MAKANTRTRRQYGKDDPNIVSYRDPKNPLTVAKAQTMLAKVERSRETRFIKDPSGLSVRNGSLYLGKSTCLGQLTPHAVFGIIHHTKAKTGVRNPNEKLLTAGLRSRDWDDMQVQVRMLKETKTITSVMTDRYQHLPYDELLTGFPKDFIVPRLQVDAQYVQVHVCEPTTLDKRDPMYLGARVLGSDVGLCRATLLDEIMRLICTNGLIRSQLTVFFKRYHLGTEAGLHVCDEWKQKVREFLSYIVTERAAERKRIANAKSERVLPDVATDELQKLGLGTARIEYALAYAEREFGKPLSRWGVAQGITSSSQFQRGDARLLTSIAVANDVDSIATRFLTKTMDEAA